MDSLLKVTIAHVDGTIFDGDVRSLTAPGSDGYLTVLKDHEPLITTLKTGDVVLTLNDGTTQRFPLTGGVLEVNGASAIIIV